VATVVIDRNEVVVARARSVGLEAIHADALDAELSVDPRLVGIGRVLCATDNDVINDVVAKRWAPDLGSENVFAWSEVCTGETLGQQPSVVPRLGALSRAARVNRGLEAGELEFGVIGPRATPLPPGIRPVFALHDGSAELVRTPAARQDRRRVVLQWARPSDRDLFQIATFIEPAPVSLEDAYRRLAERAAERLGDIGVDDVVSGIVERERTMSMEIGNGVAIPHAYCAAARQPFCVAGIVRNGIARHELERATVRIIFLLLSPVGEVEAHLESLATIARWAHDIAHIDSLVDASSPEEAIAQLVGYVRSKTGLAG
jgi:mannitol/fructose-specific phosphotransferase system IIA component (Ntr-type)